MFLCKRNNTVHCLLSSQIAIFPSPELLPGAQAGSPPWSDKVCSRNSCPKHSLDPGFCLQISWWKTHHRCKQQHAIPGCIVSSSCSPRAAECSSSGWPPLYWGGDSDAMQIHCRRTQAEIWGTDMRSARLQPYASAYPLYQEILVSAARSIPYWIKVFCKLLLCIFLFCSSMKVLAETGLYWGSCKPVYMGKGKQRGKGLLLAVSCLSLQAAHNICNFFILHHFLNKLF